MSDVPKIVQDRLRASEPREAHPDADVLTAFAEHTLSGVEREGVVRHLSRCGDCREVVALSIPPSVEATRPRAREAVSERRPAARSHSWLAWPTLHWAALAASVVVVASILLLNPAKQAKPTDSNISLPSQNKTQVLPAAETAAPLVSPPAQYSRSVVNIPAKPDKALRAKSPEVHRDEAQSASISDQVTTNSDFLSDRKRADLPASRGSIATNENKLMRIEPAPPTAPPTARMATSEKIGSVNETVEVSAGSSTVQTEDSQIGARVENAPSAPAVAKAKEPVKDEADLKAQAQDGLAKKGLAGGYLTSSALTLQKQSAKKSKEAIAQWRLIEGRLQRSLDAGANWQVALQLEHPLLAVGARGSDVWAGGQAGTLFHSTNSGAAWAMIQPSTKARSLTADIVAIEMRSADEIILSTSNNETWTTTDGGKTWGKK